VGGRLDRPHVFLDGDGEIRSASLLKANGNCRVGTFAGKTLKLGPEHSHDTGHEYHLLEQMSDPPRDLLKRFKKASKRHRTKRRKRRG
jgi:hypothetical protein